MPRLGVAGAGAWGTALALVAARAGNEVVLWGRDAAQTARMAASRRNERYLPEADLPDAVEVTSDPGRLAGLDPLLLVVPAQQVRATLKVLPAAGTLVVCAKGLEQATGLRLSEVVAAERPGTELAVLSGPSFAAEVAQGLPTAVTVAALRQETAVALSARLASLAFRPYPSTDLLGVEIAGALKNVIAIAAGVAMGKSLGENARASLITRGLAELTRLALALGARRETLMGLSGLGDLILTATSLTSRNTSFGHALATGRTAASLMGAGAKLSEGAYTAEAACRLGARLGVELPITQAVRAVIAGEIAVEGAIEALLSRPLAPTE